LLVLLGTPEAFRSALASV